MGHAHLVALDLGLTLVNDFVDLSCNIAASPFPSAAMGFSPHEIQKGGTHETSCPSFKGSIMIESSELRRL